MSPSAGSPVEDLDTGGLPLKRARIPGGPLQMLAVDPGRRADLLALDQQAQPGLARMVAPAHKEIEELALDQERRRGERALRPVSVKVRVDKAMPEIARDRH